MATNQNQKLVNRFFDEVCNQRNLRAADEIFSTDHVYHDPSDPEILPGPEGMKQLVSIYQTAVADAHWQVVETITSDQHIVTRWIGSGTHTGELKGIAPTGKKVSVQGIWIHRFAGNKIVESWNIWDTLGMLQQLGVVPALKPSTEMLG